MAYLSLGAIPCLEPQTEEEKLVYAVVKTVLSIRYRNKIAEEMLPPDEHRLPFPSKRLFLDMAYKPRWTKLVSTPAHFLNSQLTMIPWIACHGRGALLPHGHRYSCNA